MKLKSLFMFTLPAALLLVSCSKLDEQLNSSTSSVGGASSAKDVASLLKAPYNSLKTILGGESGVWALYEHTSDEAIPPTRGGDWDDNGKWRTLHALTWTPDNAVIIEAYDALGQMVFNATDLLQYKPTPQQAAEARFLRALAFFYEADGWGAISYRTPGGDPTALPFVVSGIAAMDTIILELETIMKDLPDGTVANAMIANKNAAKVLLMKAYLNKGVLANPSAPTFAVADMNKVMSYGNAITGYTLTPKYFDNFVPDNGTISTENIFVQQNTGGDPTPGVGNNVSARWYSTSHYSQPISGWNGFTTLNDFYTKFDATDVRAKDVTYPFTATTGTNMGFLIGQQYLADGTALKDRKGNPLAFTRQVAAKEVGPNLEVTGIRVYKYVPDLNNPTAPNNDLVIYRYADVLLMMAEASLRGATIASTVPSATTTDALVNLVRVRAGIAPLTGVTLSQVYDERGRELYWEGHRRSDLRRFGKFLAPHDTKNYESDPRYLFFPFPYAQVGANPNLTQNPGY